MAEETVEDKPRLPGTRRRELGWPVGAGPSMSRKAKQIVKITRNAEKGLTGFSSWDLWDAVVQLKQPSRILAGFLLAAPGLFGQVPALLHHQGRVAVGETLFEGAGRFKFALVSADASQAYWGNAPDQNADGEPDEAVALPVSRGLYSVLLGDTALPHMAALPPAVFAQPALHLQVWFDDGVHGFERLAPDTRLGAVGYAMVAATVPDGSITGAKLAPETFEALASQIAVLTSQLHALSNRHEALAASVTLGLPPGVPLVSANPADPALTGLGLTTFMDVPESGWVAGSGEGAPLPRVAHTAVWTGGAWIVWGGHLAAQTGSLTGASYDPALDRWSRLPLPDGLDVRGGHTAVWTGQAMLVWGGFGGGYHATGAAYTPAALAWSPISRLDAPPEREGHAAVWTGARMVIWGGRNAAGLVAEGGLYDPVADVWEPLPGTEAPAPRVGAVVAWSGTELIVWGGVGAGGELGSGAVLPLAEGATPGVWAATSSHDAPSPRRGHTGVWTGERLIIWGGHVGSAFLGDGAAYDPENGTWEPLPSTGAPAPRSGHVAVWTGTEMLVFGGETAGGPTATGGAYSPATGQWRSLAGLGSPAARSDATGVWTGRELLVFGGRREGTLLGALQRLNPQPAWYFYRKP